MSGRPLSPHAEASPTTPPITPELERRAFMTPPTAPLRAPFYVQPDLSGISMRLRFDLYSKT